MHKCPILLLDTLCASAAECWTDGIRRSFLSFVLNERVPSIIVSFCHLDWSTENGSHIGIEHVHKCDYCMVHVQLVNEN